MSAYCWNCSKINVFFFFIHLDIDTSALRPAFSALTKEVGRSISDLCHYQDRHRLHTHIQEVLQSESNGTQSLPYRLRLGTPDVYVHVKPISVLFRNTKPNESDFIMAVHTLLSEQEIQALESLSSSSSSNPALSLPSTSHSVSHLQHTTSSMGGPLMTSVMNGNLSHQVPPVSPSSRSNNHQSSTNNNNNSSANNNNNNSSSSNNNNMNALTCTQAPESSNFFGNSDFDFEFPHSTYEMDASISWDSRPDSRASVTPVSTPRPPSVSAYSPAAAPMCPSPLTPYHGGGSTGQPSPSNNNNNNSTNNNNISLNSNNNTLNNHSGYGGNFAFQSIDDKEKVQEQIQQHQQQQLAQQQQHQQQQQQPQPHDSERLRNLLTTKRSLLGMAMEGGGESEHTRNTNRILKVNMEKLDCFCFFGTTGSLGWALGPKK
jgi:PAS domain